MTQRPFIQLITERRSDAVHIHTKALVAALRTGGANVQVLQFNNRRFKHPALNFLLEVMNTIRTVLFVDPRAILLFADPLSFNLLAARFVRNKKYTLFFHYERDPFFYKFIPFTSYKGMLDMLDGVICSSHFSISQLRLLGSMTNKYAVVYCGLDHSLFRPSTARPYPFEYIISIGTEEPRKNMEHILKAFQRLTKEFPRLRLVKVGRASGTNRQATLEWVRKLDLAERVTFVDRVDEERLPQLYAGAQLLLFPSLLEGFGLPVIEAMACGCPVVTADRDPMAELVGPGYETVNPLDSDAIAKACKRLLRDRGYRAQVIATGLVRAREFAWEKAATETYRYLTSAQ